MDDSQNRQKVLEYWSHVFSVAESLFSNPGHNIESLRQFVGVVISTKLLPEIECLSEENEDEAYPFPMTGWLLENILTVYQIIESEHESHHFFIDAQVKLLEATYDRNVCDYLQLTKMYIDLLDKVWQARLNTPIFIFNTTHRPVLNVVIPPLSFAVQSERHRIRFLDVILKVLHGTGEYFFECCQPQDCLDLLDKLKKFVEAGDPKVSLILLPLLKTAVNCEKDDITNYKEVFRDILVALTTTLMGEDFKTFEHRTEFLDVWRMLRSGAKLTSFYTKTIVGKLSESKITGFVGDFALKEIGLMLVSLPPDQLHSMLPNFLNNNWSLYDKIYVLEHLLVKEAQDYLNHGTIKNEFSDSNCINMGKKSRFWAEMLPSLIETTKHGSVAYGRIKIVQAALSMIARTLGAVYESLVSVGTSLNFFDEHLPVVLQCIVAHLSAPPETAVLAADALVIFLNLPEVDRMLPETTNQAIQFIKKVVSGDATTGVSKEKCLQAIQKLPSGISPGDCLRLFTSVKTRMQHEPALAIQVIKCAPHLCLSGKISYAQVIAEVLMPYMLCDVEDYQVQVLESVSQITCIAAGTAHSFWDSSGPITIKCEHQKCSITAKNCDLIENHILRLLDPVFGAKPSVRLKLLEVFPHLSLHIGNGLNRSNFTQRLISFISDDDISVRHKFAEIVRSVLFGQRSVDNMLATASDYLPQVEYFFATVEKELNAQDKEVWSEELHCLTDTIMKIACCPVEEVMLPSLKLLLAVSYYCPMPMSTLTCSIAAAHGTSSVILYHTYKPEISKFFGQLIVDSFERFKIPVSLMLENLISFFNEVVKVRLLSRSEPYILMVLCAAAVRKPELNKLISDFADYIEQPLPTVITRCFQYIYVHLYFTENEETFNRAMKQIHNLANLQEQSLVQHCLKSIIHHLLFNYHRDEKKALTALGNVLEISAYNSKEIIASNLESRFVGYLLFIVRNFTKEGNAESDQVQSLKSLTAVLGLMGMKRITPVARKVLAILQSSLITKHCALQCEAWHAFVVNVNPRVIAPLLATIVVSLLPMLDRAEANVVGVLSYLLVEKRSAMEGYLQNIIFLPQHPALTKINTILSSYVSVDLSDVKGRLVKETELALHETVAVRVAGLKALYATLQKFSSEIAELINGCDTPDMSVVGLWNALLVCCRDDDEEVAASAAQCLGELGAVDPALLPRQRKPPTKVPLTVHEPEFCYLALREIVRGFQNARTSADSDAFAIGIQEIIKIFDVIDVDTNTIWARFSTSDQSLMRPMFSSRYKMQAAVRTSWPNVVFGSHDASTHLRWAALWAGKLISLCTDDKAVVLFRACEPSLKRDARVLQFFLQYIVLHILTQGPARHEEILNEMMAVLKRSTSQASTDGPMLLRLMEPGGHPLIKSSLSDADVRDSAMTVCLVIDFLQYWSLLYLTVHSKPNLAVHLLNEDYLSVKGFLEKIDPLTMASVNFEMKEYPRAVQYWEDVSRDDESSLVKHLPMLSKAYARYGDLDSVAGARAMAPSTLNISDQIFYHQVSRQWEEARILYEQLMKEGDMTPSQVEGLVTCYLRLGEPSTALGLISRYDGEAPEMAAILTDAKTECLLKLGDWTGVTNFTKELEAGDKSWSIQLMRCYQSNRLQEPITSKASEIRTAVSRNFAALGCHASAYNYDYASMVKLHILNEVESIAELISRISPDRDIAADLSRKLKQWDSKDNLVQTNSDFYEQILSTRRAFLSTIPLKAPGMSSRVVTMINETQGKLWVKSAEAARRAGCLNQAYNYIICAERYNIPETFIEKAQLLWEKGQKEESLLTLVRGTARFFSDVEVMKSMRNEDRMEDRKLTAQAKLLYAVYNEETSNCTANSNMINYQEAHEVCKVLEKNEVLLAQCLDRVLNMMEGPEQNGQKACDLRVTMLCHFGKSLSKGYEYIYQSVPRMLSVWLDLGENLVTEERKVCLKKCNKMMLQYIEIVPPFVFMTALPQLLSRIGHPNRDVFILLKAIIVKLILAHPQQCLWAMQTLSKSAVPERRQRYKEVINDLALKTPAMLKLIEDFSVLGDKLNSLTNKNLPQDSVVKGLVVSSVVRELPLLLESNSFSRIIVPVTKFCSIALPKNVTSTAHEPFMKDPAAIIGIKNELTVLASLQRPRKITFIGSDGQNYDILCKPKDDLRRDARLMEFNNIVNMNLSRDPDSRARNLHIRTYVVTPLGECGGLLEWVPNLAGLRPILMKLYTERGRFIPTRVLKKLECKVSDSLEKKKEVFLTKLIPMHPPLFSEWFRKTFPDPAAWYLARQEYTRTTAVMSMVGYILGLGDRHGENILIDCVSGDTVHVDFNCLFNKGEKFDWKERVPFRLTHNMAKAMGPCGVEGTFRKSCEMSMRVLRDQQKTLMSVLTPFAYDPFGSWSKKKDTSQNDPNKQTAEALAELTDIERRLKGSMRVNQKNNTFYLSVEGLVRALIEEAINVDNLCQMYIGWGAYL